MRTYTRLTFAAILLSFAAIASSQTVEMQIAPRGCGSAASGSVTDYKWHSKWQKAGVLVVSGFLPESGSTRVKPGSARIARRGNLLVIVYENYELERERDEKGREILATICSWRVPVTFSISGLDDANYHLVVGSETDRGLRVQTSLNIDEPSE